jgi:outer membrane protein assembly factor BamD (BamD/ComL family)
VATSRLSVEIAVIDAAKRALAGGDAAEALRQLDAYRAAFPAGTLAAEATALRIDAMARAGRRQEARALLDELRLNHPDSPLLDSLGPIVGE